MVETARSAVVAEAEARVESSGRGRTAPLAAAEAFEEERTKEIAALGCVARARAPLVVVGSGAGRCDAEREVFILGA